MKLLLAIETSWNRPWVLLGDGADRLFDSERLFDSHPGSAGTRPPELSTQVSGGIEALGAEVRDIGAIAVNVGPGRLTSIRAGIAFSNALAFSLSIPIHPFNYFQIMASQLDRITDLPALVGVPAAGDLAYVGLVRGGKVESPRFGPLSVVAEEVRAGLKEVAVAGGSRPRLLSLPRSATVVDTRIESPDGGVLFEMGLAAWERAATGKDRVAPLTEESEIFHEST
uniref:tRNA threonylcarbamoyladenosine biosynthesis protein TsaB n=1 Tax=Candidatus Kentrum sp. SD TaxID=2126332 RepID=A0A450YF72_9GAMM|nr:MAG: tRNA threonylcarbamoyladenosine biosynthesis protein TsaB [Candidatus Kentron sp. SD]VFK45738.1 MAG: tRNA threonylcarbamoyladenosine biosynthesis protein TsaB [Candidatus Kentron sp. SD]